MTHTEQLSHQKSPTSGPVQVPGLLRLDRRGNELHHLPPPIGCERHPAMGLLAASALLTAGDTVQTGYVACSASVMVLAAPDDHTALTYRVDGRFDGLDRVIRTVRCIQNDRVIALATVTFGSPRARTTPAAQPIDLGLADPHRLPRRPRRHAPTALDVRDVDELPGTTAVRSSDSQRRWVRVEEELHDRLLPHLASLAYAGGLLLSEALSTSADSAPQSSRPLPASTLGERSITVWCHHSFRSDDWTLHELDLSAAAGPRPFAIDRVYSPSGRHVASVALEQAHSR